VGAASRIETLIVDTMALYRYGWRDLDPEGTIRFFALRLGEAKLIKSTPQPLIAHASADLAWMRQLRKELTP
jgi:NitT/TauT family transport system substrate-binding protein